MLYDVWDDGRRNQQKSNLFVVTKTALLSGPLLLGLAGLMSCQQQAERTPKQLSLEQPSQISTMPTVLNTAEAHPSNELTILVPTSNLSGNSTLVQVAENSTKVVQLQAKDTPSARLSYRLQAGADIDKFTLDEGTGELAFRDVPDWENPMDEDKDNNYLVTWQVVSSSGSVRSQVLVIKVTDMEDWSGSRISMVATDANQA